MFQLTTTVTVIDALLLVPVLMISYCYWCLQVSMTLHLSCSQSSVHSDVVNSVSWGLGNKALYSGASDCLIAEWSVDSGECVRLASYPLWCSKWTCLLLGSCDPLSRSHDIQCISSCSKWKGDKRAVHCVCCHSNGELLLSAGRSIKLWNLLDHTLIKVAAPPPDSCTHGLPFLYFLSSIPGSLPPPLHFFSPLSFPSHLFPPPFLLLLPLTNPPNRNSQVMQLTLGRWHFSTSRRFSHVHKTTESLTSGRLLVISRWSACCS